MKRIKLQYFAQLRDHSGCAEETIETKAESADQLFEELLARGRLPKERNHFRVAVNAEFRDWTSPLSDCDTVVFIPPVSGG